MYMCVMAWDKCVAGAERLGGVLLSLCSFSLKEGSRGSGE